MISNPAYFFFANADFAGATPSLCAKQLLFFDSELRPVPAPTEYLAQIATGNSQSADTLKTYGSALRQFFLACTESNLAWTDIRFPELLAYRRSLIVDGKSPTTINTRLSILRQFYGWCEASLVIPESPFPKKNGPYERNPLKVRATEVPPRAIPREHLQQIDCQLSQTYSLAMKVAATTGLRASEITSLSRKQLPIPSPETSGFQRIRIRRKGGRLHDVSFPVALLDELHRYVDFGERAAIVNEARKRNDLYKNPDSVFLSQLGHPLSRTRLSKCFTTAVKRAGVWRAGWTFHSLRHTYAITLLKELQAQNERQIKEGKRGFNVLLMLRNMMGHASIATTEIYLTSLALDEPAISDSVCELYESFIKAAS